MPAFFQFIPAPCRPVILAALLSACAHGVRAEAPAFVHEAVFASGKSSVKSVAANDTADLIVMHHGMDRGFRRGMVLIVERENRVVGEIILAAVGENVAIGLIQRLDANDAIVPGDQVRFKPRGL